MDDGLLGAFVVFALAAALAGVLLAARVPSRVKTLLFAGLLLRVVGSQAYYYLSEWIYGFGDYSTYYGLGRLWSDAWTSGTLATLRSPYLADWCCTGFTVRLTGVLLTILGPTVNGAFMAFALVGYAGIVAIAVAFSRSYPDVPLERYLAWVVFFPSLWYWPAALGKDALMLGGIGVAVLGFVGRRGRTGWLSLLAAMALVFVVRPQVAAVVALSMVAAHWLGTDARWTPGRVAQGMMLIAGGVGLSILAGRALGLQLFDVQQVGTYLQERSVSSGYGGSAVRSGGLSGLVNVLFRPFPWDVSGFASGLAAIEVTALWAIVAWKRSEIREFFRAHRRSRLLWFALVFASAYVALTGMALGNLGLIARQRVLMYPFLLMFFAGSRVTKPVGGAEPVAARPPSRSRAPGTALPA